MRNNLKEIYFAGGCFWGVEEYFSHIPGVCDTMVGYANGRTPEPTYEEVCGGNTGHTETVKLVYDPEIISLRKLAEHLFKIIDPLSVNRQGPDVGSQYRTGMYYADEEDHKILAQVFYREGATYKEPLAVELAPLSSFWIAEEYHQGYLKKNPGGYCHIRFDKLGYVPA